MLKKIIVSAAFAFAAVLPAPPAVAWDEVCVHFPQWKTWYTGHFSVVHDHSFHKFGMPSHIPDSFNRDLDRDFAVAAPRHTVKRGARPADHALHSDNFGMNSSRCVDIRHIPEGEGFAVYVRTSTGPLAHCATHRSNPDMYYKQAKRPHRKIWWRGTGVAWSPSCHFWRESN